MSRKFYITTPIYYVNARPHIGHAYTTIACDTIARRQRMLGADTFFLTGTDEHGQKIERAAQAAGKTPQQYADEISAQFRKLWQRMGISNDDFIRTTEDRHKKRVQELFRRIRDNGYIYKGTYTGQYCVSDELYVDSVEPGAPCPNCGRPTETVQEENYFFKLSALQDQLLKLYANPDFIRPEARRNEVISFVRGGLRDLSISRTTLKWGIPWQGDEKHVFYVWSDALTNYLTAVGYPIRKDEFARYWPADVHLIGKEIIRFHAVYWPAFLMAAGLDLPMKIFAHGHLLFQDEKMSKSRGNIQSAQPIVSVLGVDALRYFLLREIVFGGDGGFGREALIARYNSDLANGLGNLASRTAAMIDRSFGGKIPKTAELQRQDQELAKVAQTSISEVLEHYDRFEFSRALEVIWSIIAAADKYLTTEQPWSLGASDADQQRRGTILWVTAEVLRIVTALAHPVLPESTAKVWKLLGQTGNLASLDLDNLRWGQLLPGIKLGEFQALFPRVEKTEAMERIEAMENQSQKPAAAPASATPGNAPASAPAAASAAAPAPTEKIGIEDFAKVEMRVGQIQTAERIAGADKLLKLTVDIGTEVRQICAGIAQFYEPEKLIGRKVAVVTNLAPRKLRGVESNGMIVAASVGPEGRPVLAGFLEDVEVGARLK